MKSLVISVAFVFLVACGAAPSAVNRSTTTTPEPSTGPLMGQILYQARSATFAGVSTSLEERPARHVRLRAFDQRGQLVGETSTDEGGQFLFDASVQGAVRVEILTEVAVGIFAISVTRDPLGRTPYSMSVPVGIGPNRIVAPDDTDEGIAGAFHILDTLLLGEQAVRGWLGEALPPLFAYWGRGVTSQWSWYEGEVPEGSGRYKLELLGGERGRRTSTDTDEHDEAVVLHELGHFVFDRLSSASSAGGQHPGGHFVDPGLAWEEGRASWFGALVLGHSLYTDTVGMAPSGGLQTHIDLESRNRPPRGLGSQESVEEVLWDLVDGSRLIPTDHDADGVALNPVVVLQAMIDLGREPNAFPCFPTFLRYLVDREIATEDQIRAVLRNGSLPESLLPTNGSTPWPFELPPGEAGRRGSIDSISDPAPSGGPRLPHTGYDAVHTYRLVVEEPSTLELDLQIEASGGESDRSDLDLELRSLRSSVIATSRGTSAEERISRAIEPGHYIVRVVDGGAQGARARYRLRARLTRR